MITFLELKDLVQRIEQEIVDKDILLDSVAVNFGYMEFVNNIDLHLVNDGYYGTYVQIEVK